MAPAGVRASSRDDVRRVAGASFHGRAQSQREEGSPGTEATRSREGASEPRGGLRRRALRADRLMPVLRIGRRRITYGVRESTRASRQRIEATPAGVVVIVPTGTPDFEVTRFVDSRRRWIHDKTEELKEAVARLNARTPTGYHSGAKVLFRGRFLRLRGAAIVRSVATKLGLPHRLQGPAFRSGSRSPKGTHLSDRRRAGSEDRVGQLRSRPSATTGPKAVRVPRPVFEYVVVHEICHLRHRDHSAVLWALVRDLLSEYREPKGWLCPKGLCERAERAPISPWLRAL